ncbi:MAG TPA: glycine zipper 2TM domain-containing protein [Luteimonas sp.]|nr:glycine zipper 2TM domain-containing protein [Luteimonas sp.]HRO27462.1 glycine zipper 2TM domain-containing protein [Luteimonas sp.]HRP73237.1 glycine zipper 2TM domain-containing protein [Luteimonas sp.]
MKLLGIPLAVALVLSAGAASAQVYVERDGPAPYGTYGDRAAGDRYDGRYDDRLSRDGSDRYGDQGHYDWARVLRVDPVFDGRSRPVNDQRRCQTRRDGYASRDPYRGDGYRGDGYYGDDYRRDDRYPDPYGQARRDDNGRMVATVLGGIAGAVLGSKIGDGSGQYIGTAVGSMVGGMAGRGIYDANRRERDAYVTVCEPDPYRGDGGYDAYGRDVSDRAVDQYDVTYEYAGREYTTRTSYHPGDRIRVRVDVRAE